MTQTKSLSFTASFGAHGLAVAALLVVPLLGTSQLPIVIGEPATPWHTPLPRVALWEPKPTPTPQRKTEEQGGGQRGGITVPVSTGPDAPLVAPNTDGIAPAIADDLDPWIEEGFPECWGPCTGKRPPTGQHSGPILEPVAAVKAGSGGIVFEPRRISGAQPPYPELARAAGVQGTVVLECRIAVNGFVENVTVRSGQPLLNGAAVAAVQGWRYVPTLLNGRPVAVLLMVTVQFRLR